MLNILQVLGCTYGRLFVVFVILLQFPTSSSHHYDHGGDIILYQDEPESELSRYERQASGEDDGVDPNPYLGTKGTPGVDGSTAPENVAGTCTAFIPGGGGGGGGGGGDGGGGDGGDGGGGDGGDGGGGDGGGGDGGGGGDTTDSCEAIDEGTPPTLGCVNKPRWDPTNHTCCREKLFRNVPFDVSKCCKNGIFAYNTIHQVCVNGKRVDKTKVPECQNTGTAQSQRSRRQLTGTAQSQRSRRQLAGTAQSQRSRRQLAGTAQRQRSRRQLDSCPDEGTPPNATGCVKKAQWDETRHTCCGNGHLFRNVAFNISRCCNNRFGYDPRERVCFKKKRLPIADFPECQVSDDTGGDDEVSCQDEGTPPNATGCVNKPQWDATRHTCCGKGHLFRNVPFSTSKCCKDRFAYNPTEKVCINGKREPIADFPECKDTGGGDNGGGDGGDGGGGGDNGGGDGGDGGGGDGGGSNTASCGNEVFNTDTQVCCQDGNQFQVSSKGTNDCCCGLTAFDSTQQICCGGVLRNVGTMVNPECCGNLAIDSNSRVCCNGRFHNHSPATHRCCGTAAYSTATHLCCDRQTNVRPLQVVTRENGCFICQGQFLNTLTKMCCDDRRQNIGTGFCCGIRAMPPPRRPSICCNGRIRGIRRGRNYKCCGTRRYDIDLFRCIDGSLERI